LALAAGSLATFVLFADEVATEPVIEAVAPHVAPTPAETLDVLEPIYHKHVFSLADPVMEGRAPGTDGNRRAAEYIEFYYKQFGLQPAFSQESTNEAGEKSTIKSFRQVFEAPKSRRPGDSIKIERQSVTYRDTSLAPSKEFNVLGYSASGNVTGSVVFVGYSIEEGEADYTSYPLKEGAEADLTGKIALMLRFEPMDESGKSKWIDRRWSAASLLNRKINAALDHGAAGIILVNPPGADDPRTSKLDDVSLGEATRAPVVMLSQEAADALLKTLDPQGRSLMDFRRLADDNGEVIDLAGAPVTLDVKVQHVPILTDNVGAILPGVGALAEEYIVVGSHYDHVGYGYFGSREPEDRGKLHPGADDNASGSSGNILVARRLAQTWTERGETPRRSILFLAFSAEESGLNGSKFYCKNPIAPLEKHELMMNMDMIGRLREGKLELGGVGTAKGMREWITPYADASGLTVALKNSGLGPSDHASFANAGVPALFFFTGLHKEYHRPPDTPDLINVEGAVQVADLVYRVALDAALRTEPFDFTSANGREAGADPEKAHGEEDPNVAQTSSGSGRGMTVRFGIAPGDYSGEDGVMVGETFPDLPAAKAGLQAGDRMVEWNGKPIKTVEDWMPLLTHHKPGDKVTIKYLRKVDGVEKELTTEATLVSRRTGAD
jgi:hypothetical protein